jgi:hypothetical protein
LLPRILDTGFERGIVLVIELRCQSLDIGHGLSSDRCPGADLDAAGKIIAGAKAIAIPFQMDVELVLTGRLDGRGA